MNWLVYALIGAMAAAATSILGKVGVSSLPSNFAVLVRTIVVLAFVAALVLVRGEVPTLSSVRPKDWLALVLSGLATGASWLAFYKALQMAPASWVVPVDKLSLALTVVLAALFLGEPLTARTALGTALMVLGALCIAWRT
jgi:transporter family protein